MVVRDKGEETVLVQDQSGFAMQLTVEQTKRLIGALHSAIHNIQNKKKRKVING